MTGPLSEVERLRQWLHRVEEACARCDATDNEQVVREMAIDALRGDPAPRSFGQYKPYTPGISRG